MHHPLDWIGNELTSLERAGLRRHLTYRTSPQTAHVELAGRLFVNFSSNDYLGLAADRRLVAAARASLSGGNWGSGASPVISGRSVVHAELESRLAEFEGTEAALLFPSGYAANAGTIPALVDRNDALFSDAKNHASIIDGCRLSRARRFVYAHSDCAALEQMLQQSHGFRRRLIVTDSLFSMDGDLAPLARLADLAEQYDAMLMVDEAHATAVFGSGGRGVVEHLAEQGGAEKGGSGDLDQRVHIRVGTLSKALGAAGGFVCGTQALIDWLANRARSYVFSTAHPAATSAAALAALDIVKKEPQRRQQLLQQAEALRRQLNRQGWHTGPSESQIIPVYVGRPETAMRLAARLQEAGLLVPPIRPPTVPPGESLLRISLCCSHTGEMIEALAAELGKHGLHQC